MLYSAAPADTVAHWLKGRPFSAFLDRSNATVKSSIEGLQKTGWFGHTPLADQDGTKFYLMNHAATTIAQKRDLLEPLPENEVALLKLYADEGARIAARLFYYTLMITTREARHNQSSDGTGTAKMVLNEVKPLYPDLDSDLIEAMYKFTRSAPDTSMIMEHMLKPKTENFVLGAFSKVLSTVFHNCSWNGGYGGPAWGNIADALHAFVTGEWTAEMFSDTAFTLAHNGGPMFNKGMLYSGHGNNFMMMLDVQRAGMIPLWLNSEFGTAYRKYANEAYVMAQKAVPEIFEGELDWDKVQSLGAECSYHHLAALKPKVPKGCKNEKIEVDYNTSVWILEARAA